MPIARQDKHPDDANLTTYFYRVKFQRKERTFNRPRPLADYLLPLIAEKSSVMIAELGSGPINTIGNVVPGVDVTIMASDVMWPAFEKTWIDSGKTPLVPVCYQDFEALTYADNTFDIVHCANAIDHTKDVIKALSEMHRICKVGGWIYLRHATYQRLRYGGGHYWNILDQDGECVFANRRQSIQLGSTFTTTVLENEEIVSVYQKADNQPLVFTTRP